MEFLVQYDMKIEYIKGKENRLVHALRRKIYNLNSISNYKFDLKDKLFNYQHKETFCINQKERIRQGMQEGFLVKNDGLIYFDNRLVIPLEANLIK